MLRGYRIHPELSLLARPVGRDHPIRRRHAAIRPHGCLRARPASRRSPGGGHQQRAVGRIELPKVHLHQVVGGIRIPGMLDLGGDFVVDDSLLIFAYDVDAKFEMVLGLELVRLRLSVFGG
jgi:hypothetical protein